jgi:hypothetical protein
MIKIHNYVPLVHGVPADIYHSVMQFERRELYPDMEHSRNIHRRYRTGLFSMGRPGIIADHEGDR